MNRPTRPKDDGVALVLALIVTAVCLALGLGVATIASVESAMNGAARAQHVALAAADAAAERALADLGTLSSWTPVLNGSVVSSFSGGPLVVTVPRRGTIDLAAMTAALQAASDAFLLLGANTPRWRLYAWGWLHMATGDAPARGLPLTAVWVSDDLSETDTDPEADTNGRIGLRAVAFGPLGAERAVELTISQLTDPVGVNVIAWRTLQ